MRGVTYRKIRSRRFYPTMQNIRAEIELKSRKSQKRNLIE